MRRISTCVVSALALGAALSAPGGPLPAQAIREKPRLVGEEKIRYLLRQLELTEQQAALAEELLAALHPDQAPERGQPAVEEVRKLYRELEQAKQAGDQQRVDALLRRFEELGERVATDDEFFASMDAHLTDAQKARLAAARARLARNGSGGLRPIDLLRAASDLVATPEQAAALRQARQAARERLGPILRPSDSLKLEMVNMIVERVTAALTPEQCTQYELRIRALRPDLIHEGLRVTLPPERPAGQSAPQAQTAPGR